jgi:predicted AAA+ superfamily ATPase
VDEFQYCKNSERIFKNLYDDNENIKIFASGSSSLNIKNLIQESLAGRKIVFKIYPLNLEEFISWRIGKNFDLSIFKDIKNLKDI